jgi:hypothetical protein
MGKVKPGLIKITGKISDDLIIDRRRSGEYSRKNVPVKSKKRLAALKKHYRRNIVLNKLAAELNNIIRNDVGQFKPTSFYRRMLSLFRREPEDNRFFLLQQLKGMEINPSYPMSRLGHCTVTVNTDAENILLTLQTTSHPATGKQEADCYRYDVTLICWNKTKRSAMLSRQGTDWIFSKEGLPLFDFTFPKPAGNLHWVVCLKQQLGVAKKEIGAFAAQGMQIAETGSTDKRDMQLLAQRLRKMEVVGKPKELKNEKVELVRVKARR